MASNQQRRLIGMAPIEIEFDNAGNLVKFAVDLRGFDPIAVVGREERE